MSFRKFLNADGILDHDKILEAEASKNNKKVPDEPISKMTEEEFIKLLKEVDPSTNKPYKIPMLTTADPFYSTKYVSYMEMRKYNPEGFNKILNWE